ncbi:MAG TPA: hypothetical protein VFS25_09850 [Chitinophaga sp.]|uniref:hypothetical protein n=1 Tax=Chitinophaga sp. TaxID=1869181 RepID=UPI002DB99DB1|nr:hypothetical protein [Chitinophaga sp.]HEU4553129.1 hypothetical protein [Chitinophaga sp.]
MRYIQYTHHRAFLAAALIITWLLQGCNGCNRPKAPAPSQDTAAAVPAPPTAKDTLRNWAEQRLIQWKGWVDSSMAGTFGPDSLERIAVDTVADVDTTSMEVARFEQFRQFFVYSPDSTRVIDMVSYGNFLHKGPRGTVVLESGEPDTEVAIVDVQTKKRERILFTGPSTVIKQVVWINNHTVLIAGGNYDENDQLQPAIWKYDTQSKLLENWESDLP